MVDIDSMVLIKSSCYQGKRGPGIRVEEELLILEGWERVVINMRFIVY